MVPATGSTGTLVGATYLGYHRLRDNLPLSSHEALPVPNFPFRIEWRACTHAREPVPRQEGKRNIDIFWKSLRTRNKARTDGTVEQERL